MNEIIKITSNDQGEQLVSGRELHEFLEIKTQYSKWFERMTEYGFTEDIDYTAISQKRLTAQGNRTEYIDHAINLDMAKEISMIQRNNRGKQARQYFLQVERAWNSPEMVMARGMAQAQKMLDNKDKLIAELKPKALFAEAVETSKTTILVGELAKILKQNGVEMGQTRLFAWLRDNGYLIKRKGSDWNMPTQRSMELGLFEIKETVINKPDGHVQISKTPKISGKGQRFFINKFLGDDLAS